MEYAFHTRVVLCLFRVPLVFSIHKLTHDVIPADVEGILSAAAMVAEPVLVRRQHQPLSRNISLVDTTVLEESTAAGDTEIKIRVS